MNRNKLFHTVNSILYMYTVYNGKTYGYINEFFFRKYRNNSKIDYKFKSKLNYIFLVLKFLGMYIYLQLLFPISPKNDTLSTVFFITLSSYLCTLNFDSISFLTLKIIIDNT